MELKLTQKEAQVLHSVVEHYLSSVRDVYGHNRQARPLLEDEQDTLEEILNKLHTASSTPAR